MYLREDTWMMEKIFSLSDHALIKMINHMFRKEYRTDAGMIREWSGEERLCIRLTIGNGDQYEYRLIHECGCFQVQALECGGKYYSGRVPLYAADRVKEAGRSYCGENIQEEGSVMREYEGKERIYLKSRTVTLAGCSAARLREMGMTIFLPFLFYWFLGKEQGPEQKQSALKYLLIYDIPETLSSSLREGDVKVYDVQRLKQFCRKTAWELLVMEEWMRNLEMQTLVVETLDTDLELLEQIYQTVLLQIRPELPENGGQK